MNIRFIISDPPYGTRRLYNALRLAQALCKVNADVTVFFMADAVIAARQAQTAPARRRNARRQQGPGVLTMNRDRRGATRLGRG
jgi:uncharacterized protein involved in oxidation of intracellular sulfur